MSKIPDGWKIEYNIKPIPDRRNDFDFIHIDYDGENGLCGTGESVEDCIQQIKEIEEEI